MNTRMLTRGSALALLFTSLALAACANSPVDTAIQPASRDRGNDRLLVTLHTAMPSGIASLSPSGRLDYQQPGRHQVRAAQIQAAQLLADTYELQIEDEWEIPSLEVYCFVFRLPGAGNKQQLMAELRQHPEVESVQSLHYFHGQSASAVPYAPDPLANWNTSLLERLTSIHRQATGDSVSIAVIDAGVDMAHEDLAGAPMHVIDFVDGSRTGVPPEAHGTAVVGLLSARVANGVGIRGYAPDAEILLIRACWEPGSNKDGTICNSFTLAKALSLAIESGADIVNLSISGPRDPLLERLAGKLVQRGQIVVAAGTGDATFPGSVAGSILATRYTDVADASPAALTLLPGNRYGMRNGTSIAAARVTGVIALARQLMPELTAKEFEDLLAHPPEPMTSPVIHTLARLLQVSSAPRSAGQ